HIFLGMAYLAAREASKAIDLLTKTAAFAPEDPSAHYWLGVGLVGVQGRIEEARKELEAALMLKPDYVEPLNVLVQLANTQRKPQAALDLIKRQLVLAPPSAPLHHLLGITYLGLGEEDKAEQALAKAIELDPKFSASYLALAQLYGRTNRYD